MASLSPGGSGGARVRVALQGGLEPGTGRVVQAGARAIAVFNVDGRYFALDNRCLHRGGPLGNGDLDGAIVTCPWHGWRWDVRTGASVNLPAQRVACFPVTVEPDGLFVDLS